jgi:hypothetical protein
MLKELRIVQTASQAIGKAVAGVVEQLNDGLVEHEPAMTDRFVQSIQTAVDGLSDGKLKWRAKTLTDRGRKSQESVYGADIVATLDVRLPKLTVKKGFLAQAKLVKPGRPVGMPQLREQCEKMLSVSPASFVFVYSTSGVSVVPAVTIANSDIPIKNLYSRSVQSFFEEHFECFIGDQSICTPSASGLEVLRERTRARHAIEISLRQQPR